MSRFLQDMQNDGFSKVSNVFASCECEELLEAAARMQRMATGRHFTERFGNVRFFNNTTQNELRSVIWCGLLDRRLEAFRRDARIFEVLSPLLGNTIRQVTNQIHFKQPGSLTSFPLHTDRSSRMRDQGPEIQHLENCFYQVGIVAEKMSLLNGGMYFLPGSHVWSAESPYAKVAEMGRKPEADFADKMPENCVAIEAEAGDVLVWSGDTVHGSALNQDPQSHRVLYINGYVRGTDTLRGYWAWIDGIPVPLPSIDVPVLVYGDPDLHYFIDARRVFA